MKNHLVKDKKFLQGFVILSAIICTFWTNVFGQLGLQVPNPPKTVQLFEPTATGLSSFFVDSTLFKKNPPLFQRIVKLDSSGKFVSATESVDKKEFFLPVVVDLETYIQKRIIFDRQELWRKVFAEKISKQEEKESGAIELDIPIRIKNKTFTRIFGSDRVGLRVTGNISFDLSGRSEERSGAATSAAQNQGSFSPRFSQTQQFTIEGKIGEKVTVSVEQNSEATFDFENTLKLRYDGEEDEIIQTIEAGNIGLSLPSTKYLIFGGSNKGLFGLKTDLKVGDFYFTGIASLEKGEQQKLEISGSSSENKVTIRDYDFMQYRYFFIDDYYLNYFERGFSEDLSTWLFEGENRLIRDIDVYKSIKNTNGDARPGVAAVNPENYAGLTLANYDTVTVRSGRVDKGTFARLEQGKDYEYDYARGFLWMKQVVQDNEILAIAYKTDNIQVGTLFDTTATDNPYVLKMIKPQSMQPSYKDTWPLMMRNVYSLGGSNIEKEGFDIRIEFNLNGEHETVQQEEPRKSFLYLMGLDRIDENGGVSEDGDKKVDDNALLINRQDGILIFPSLKPFDPQGNRFQIADTNRVRIYETNDKTLMQDRTKFDMIVTSKSTKSTFDLGFNILEGSEEVFLNGSKLKRDTDYIIDYFTGQLTLISNEAKRSSANIEIKYEKATIFQLDKKTIFGGRAEYRFWDDSFIGLTALYMNKSTLDQRVRIGQEPFSNFVWDINTALKFKPKFLTDWADAIPFVNTNEQSTVQIEAEFAQVLPNPNTLDNDATGDKNGVAYIDDFEGTKRTTTLGIRYLTWTPASPPLVLPELGNSQVLDTLTDRSRGRINWFNPFNQVLIKDIWPNRDVNSQTGQTTDVLAIQAWRKPGQSADSAWAGMMRSTSSFANQQKTKFIEMWVRGDTVNSMRVHIDIGQISEDWYMKTVKNGKLLYGAPSLRGLNTEDRNKNGILDEGEDTGVDGIPNGQFGDDPFDNWREPNRSTADYSGINGTEGNSQARGANYPDTEDLDGNGQVNLINNYFEYSFTLDPNDEKSTRWISGSTSKGWKQFRIPLNEYEREIGNPDTTFQTIYFVRLWVSNLDTVQKSILIATFDFVGNEWEEEGIAQNDSSDFVQNDSLFSITVYNSEENAVFIEDGPEPYHSPPGVSGIEDRITKAVSKEQSIVFRLTDLQPGAFAEARKTLYGDILSLVNYKQLRMFVHGDQWLPSNPADQQSPIRMYIKFGSDKNNYYEYGQQVYAHWYEGNEIDIDLDELTRTKNLEEIEGLTKVKIKYLNTAVNSYYKVKGNPNLNTIRYFRVGIQNIGGTDLMDRAFPWTGEIWLDEMRVSNVRQESGTALRLRTNVKMADLLTFNGEWESKDADFHDVKSQFGTGFTTETQNYSGLINLDKFLPDDWDISMPVDARASFNKQVPKYFPKTDILTHYKNNTVEKKLQSLFGTRKLDPELEKNVSYSEVYGMGTTIKKRSRSESWYFQYTIDQITFDVDYSLKNSRNYETEFNRSEQWRETVSYSIPWGRNNFVEPFKSLQKTPVLDMFSDQKFYYSPSNTNMSLNISDVKQKNKLRNDDKLTTTINTNSTRKITLGYKMLPSLDFSYGRTHKADADYAGLNSTELIKSILTKFDFGQETDIDQQFKMDYKPKFFRWLTSDYSYTANFHYFFSNLAKNQKQSNNKVTRRVTFSFSPSQLANMIYKPTPDTPAASSRTRGRPKRPSEEVKPGEEEDKADEDKKEGEEKTEEKTKKKQVDIKFPNPLIWIHSFFDAWQNIQTSYTWDQNITNAYVSKLPSWKYQFGITNDPGVEQDTSQTNGFFIGPSVTDSRSLRSSMSYDISKNIKATFNHEYNTSETHNDQTRNGSEGTTMLAWGDDPAKDFGGIGKDIRTFIPDWSVKISGLENFLFFSEFAKSVSLDHSRSGKYNTTKKLVGADLVPATETYNHSYQPLVGININWFFGLTSTIRLTKSATYNFNSGGGATKTETNSFTISASYATSGGFQIPIPIWPFKGKTFKNEMNFTLTYDRSNNITFQKQFDQASFQENQNNSSWKLRPSATYRFNKRVSGSLFYETGVSENKISGKYSYNEFGITVNIAIRD